MTHGSPCSTPAALKPVYKTRLQSCSFPTLGKITEAEEVPPGRMEDDGDRRLQRLDRNNWCVEAAGVMCAVWRVRESYPASGRLLIAASGGIFTTETAFLH